MISLAKLVILAAAFPFAALAQPMSPSFGRTPSDDCAAIAAMLEGQLTDLPGKKGDMAKGSYGADCDWKALGVKSPKLATAKSKYFFWFVRPDNANDGHKRRIERDEGFGGNGPDEKGGTLIVGYCDAERKDENWRLVSCVSGMYFSPDKVQP